MIKTKEDLKYYLEQDRLNLRAKGKKPKRGRDEIWRYEIILRHFEYYLNKEKKSFFDKLRLKHYRKLHHKLSVAYTTSIPPNVTGPGLSIGHIGTIYVNSKSKVGKNLRIQSGVTIGGAAGKEKLPVLGDNVYLGSGCKVIGPVEIANDVAIGANAVVTKSILEPGTTWAGVPARKISDNNSHAYMSKDVVEGGQ